MTQVTLLPTLKDQIDSWVSPFVVTERFYSDDDNLPSVGLANIEAVVPGIEENKEKILRALEIFKAKKVNVALFPEFCLSGYFWEDEEACWRYMDQAVIENHTDWIEKDVKSFLDENLHGVILNNIRRGPEKKYYNSTYIISQHHDYLKREDIYTKDFLPAIEKTYTESGRDNRLVIETPFARIGFTTCYDFMFAQLILEYTTWDEIDVLMQLASWRAMSRRDYPRMNVKSDVYYGYLWDLMMPATAATHQIWTIACNAVGRHGITGAHFWGGSGLWAPSGLPLVQASRVSEELLIIHNIDFKAQRQMELDDFHYALDFNSIYRPIHGKRAFTRIDL